MFWVGNAGLNLLLLAVWTCIEPTAAVPWGRDVGRDEMSVATLYDMFTRKKEAKSPEDAQGVRQWRNASVSPGILTSGNIAATCLEHLLEGTKASRGHPAPPLRARHGGHTSPLPLTAHQGLCNAAVYPHSFARGMEWAVWGWSKSVI